MEEITNRVRPFDFIRRTDPAHLLNVIRSEHPQTIALILAYLEPDKASIVLQNLPHDLQGEVASRIATIGIVIPEILRGVEQTLEKKFSTLSDDDYAAAGGIESIVEILKIIGRDSEKQIVEAIGNRNHELAEEIKTKMLTKSKFKWMKWLKHKITLQ